MQPTEGAGYDVHADRPLPCCAGAARSRLPCVVTKKRRRTQLARAGAQRQQLRRAERDRRRRRTRLVLTTAVVLLALAGLVTWIVLHAKHSESAASARGDYASLVDLAHKQPTGQATTAEGAR